MSQSVSNSVSESVSQWVILIPLWLKLYCLIQSIHCLVVWSDLLIHQILVYKNGCKTLFLFCHLKGAWSYFSKFSFLFHLKNHHSKDVNSKFQLKQSSCFNIWNNFVYCVAYVLLYKLNYGYHNQTHFHQYFPNGTLFSC